MKARPFKEKTWSKKPVVRRRARQVPKASMIRGTKTELKSVDIPETTVQIQAGSLGTVINTVNTLVAGNQFYQRVGNEIRMKSLYINGEITPNFTNAAGNLGEYCRIMVIYDNQTNKATPVFSDIILSITQAGATSSTAFDGINITNKKRFKVLMDERVVLPVCGVAGASGSNVNQTYDQNNTKINISRYIKLGGLETTYITGGGAGTVADITTGGLYVFVLGTTTVANTVAYEFSYSTRLRYYD